MDRQQAAIHYVEQAEIALRTTLEWCKTAYGQQAADQLSRIFSDNLFGQNFAAYNEPGEVLSFWGAISRRPVTDKSYGGEFVIMLHTQFSYFVEPAVISESQSAIAVTNLTPLGHHLVSTIARAQPLLKYPADQFHDELAGFEAFMKDVPTPAQVISILSYFPWMAPFYLLMFSQPETLKAILVGYQSTTPAANATGA